MHIRCIIFSFYHSRMNVMFDGRRMYSISVECKLYEFDAEFDNPEVGKFDHY